MTIWELEILSVPNNVYYKNIIFFQSLGSLLVIWNSMQSICPIVPVSGALYMKKKLIFCFCISVYINKNFKLQQSTPVKPQVVRASNMNSLSSTSSSSSSSSCNSLANSSISNKATPPPSTPTKPGSGIPYLNFC